MMYSVNSILLIFLTKFLPCIGQVKVLLQTHPVRYGKDMNLECSSLQYHKDWHWFRNNALLFRNHRPADNIDVNKYKEESIDDLHRKLTIHTFQFDDIGRYLCTNGVFDGFIDLSQETKNFIYFDNSTKTTVKQQGTTYGINISAVVSNVWPLPGCQLQVEKKMFPLHISEIIPKEAIASVVFHTKVFNVSFFCRQPANPLRVVCDIRGIPLDTIFSKNCSDIAMKTDEKASDMFPAFVILVCFLLICVGLFVLFFKIRRSQFHEPVKTSEPIPMLTITECVEYVDPLEK